MTPVAQLIQKLRLFPGDPYSIIRVGIDTFFQHNREKLLKTYNCVPTNDYRPQKSAILPKIQ